MEKIEVFFLKSHLAYGSREFNCFSFYNISRVSGRQGEKRKSDTWGVEK